MAQISPTVEAQATTLTDEHPPIESRRDFLYLATGATVAVGLAATAWPMIDQMNPDAETIARGGPFDVDLSPIAPGQQIVVKWQEHPVFIVRRTPEALKTLKDPKLLARLRDPDSQAMQQPVYAANWSRSIEPEFLVLVGVYTHLGCIPNYFPKPDSLPAVSDWPGGYFCPCHGSKYDLAGRVFDGVPAPYNLPVPPYHFPNPKTLRIGENPTGQTFDFGNVVQV
jgi:ubiquinol-cytochrome c reductase iron-sulfur subunit